MCMYMQCISLLTLNINQCNLQFFVCEVVLIMLKIMILYNYHTLTANVAAMTGAGRSRSSLITSSLEMC